MKDNLNVDSSDMNGIDFLGGSASVSSKGPVVKDVYITHSDSLKGALAKFSGGFNTFKARQFIYAKRNQITEYLTERFKYSGLPDGLDKYRFEEKVFTNGSALFIKHGDKFYMVNYTHSNYNIYNEPTQAVINEPKSTVLNKMKVNLSTDGVVVRNNLLRIPTMNLIYRHIDSLEKILFQIEKNILTSSPKGILNLKHDEIVFEDNKDRPEEDSFNDMIMSENTFFALKTKSFKEQKLNESESNDLFIPIELTDRTENLIKNYQFTQDLIKEMIGSLTSKLSDKKERLITDEQESQQGLTNGTREHSLEIRKVDIEKINKMYGTKIQIELQTDERDKESEGQKKDGDGGKDE